MPQAAKSFRHRQVDAPFSKQPTGLAYVESFLGRQEAGHSEPLAKRR
jgi:hypothetical protein